MLPVGLIILGILLLGVVLVDAFLTILGMRGGGPLTNLWMRGIWRLLLWIHRRRESHWLLSIAGPALTLCAILVWYGLMLLGWLCVFAATDSVIDDSSRTPANFLERLYFVWTTVSSVGYGDYVPTTFPWTVLATASAFTATFLVTTSLSYLVPVISAALERKQLAQNIYALGSNAAEIVRSSWTGRNAGFAGSYWLNVFSAMNDHAHKHLVYPVLHYFHSYDQQHSSARAALQLSDAIFLISQAASEDSRPPQGFIRVAQGSLRSLATLRNIDLVDASDKVWEIESGLLTRDTLIELGIEPVSEQEFKEGLDRYRPLRTQLIQLCIEDGWCR